MTLAEIKKARKETIAWIKKVIKPGAKETKFLARTKVGKKDSYLKIFFFASTHDAVQCPKKSFVLDEAYGVCVDGIVELAHGGAISIMDWDDIPMEDLLVLDDWIASILRVRSV